MENRKQVKYLTYLYHKMYGSFLAKKTWKAPPPLLYESVATGQRRGNPSQ